MNFIQLFFSTKGKIDKKEFWLGMLGLFFIELVLLFATGTTIETIFHYGVREFSIDLFLAYPYLAVTIKRLRDIDINSWWALSIIFIFPILIIGLIKNKDRKIQES